MCTRQVHPTHSACEDGHAGRRGRVYSKAHIRVEHWLVNDIGLHGLAPKAHGVRTTHLGSYATGISTFPDPASL